MPFLLRNNIYFRRPNSGGMRDIFLAPFGPKLLLCVLGTSFLLAIVMISITIVYYRIERKKRKIWSLSDENAKKEGKKWKISDAILWSVSILCMQGELIRRCIQFHSRPSSHFKKKKNLIIKNHIDFWFLSFFFFFKVLFAY